MRTLDEAKEAAINNISSIFTKEDVIALLDSIEETEVDEEELRREIEEEYKDMVRNMDFEEVVEAEIRVDNEALDRMIGITFGDYNRSRKRS